MRIINVKWYSVIVTILFIVQSMLLLVLLQPQPGMRDNNIQSSPQCPSQPIIKDNCPSIERVPCDPHIRADDVQGMAYLYNKFRVAATEVKRQVMKRKGERVDAVPPPVRPACVSNIIAATYNLWNINPPWPTRLSAIVSLIKDVQPHFVGVQEIRIYEGKNQLDILKEHLTDYRYSVYEKVQDEQRGKEEGLGILSKYPILESSSINFGNTNRKCLRSLIQTPHGNINFFVTHFSLNDIEQCTHALMLWEHLNSFPPHIPQIVVGDMNTYFDFEWPMDLLTQGLTPFMLGPLNPCSGAFHKYLDTITDTPNIITRNNKDDLSSTQNETQSFNFHVVKDAWEELYPAVPKNERMLSAERWWGSWAAPSGHTFTNYGDQDPSRTDRLYFYSPESSQLSNKHLQSNKKQQPNLDGGYLKLCEVKLFGDSPIRDPDDNIKVLYPSDHKGVAGYFLMENIP